VRRTLAATCALLAVCVIAAVASWRWSVAPGDSREARMRELVNLEGNPRPDTAARHVRVVALDVALAVKWPGNNGFWPDDDAMYDSIRMLGQRLYNTQADVLVLFNTPFAGTRVRDIAVGELLAVETARPWRVESTSWNRSWSALGGPLPAQQVGQIDAGALVLSRWPVTAATYADAQPLPHPTWAQTQWGATGSITDVTIEAGPEQTLHVQVRDVPGEPLTEPPSEPLHVVVSHDAVSAGAVTNTQIAESTQVVWSADLRHLQHANHNDLQGLLAEPLLLVDLGIAPDANIFVPPSARDGSADANEAAAPEGATHVEGSHDAPSNPGTIPALPPAAEPGTTPAASPGEASGRATP
jgi:hypothetical protein